MFINGRKPQGLNIVPIILPRANAADIVFKAQAVADADEFDKLYPRPEPPMMLKAGVGKIPDLNNKEYQEEIKNRATAHTDFLVLKSIEVTPDLKWETVDMKDPSSWGNWRKECKDAGIIDIEINRILVGVMEANSLNERVIEAARERFLASQVVVEESD